AFHSSRHCFSVFCCATAGKVSTTRLPAAAAQIKAMRCFFISRTPSPWIITLSEWLAQRLCDSELDGAAGSMWPPPGSQAQLLVCVNQFPLRPTEPKGPESLLLLGDNQVLDLVVGRLRNANLVGHDVVFPPERPPLDDLLGVDLADTGKGHQLLLRCLVDVDQLGRRSRCSGSRFRGSGGSRGLCPKRGSSSKTNDDEGREQ